MSRPIVIFEKASIRLTKTRTTMRLETCHKYIYYEGIVEYGWSCKIQLGLS